jgi:hypothetical protein
MSARPDTLPGEQWKHHPRWRKFMLSTDGRVFNTKTGRIVRGVAGGGGGKYLKVQVGSRKSEYEYVHVLVLETFDSERPPGMVVCHANDDGRDNRFANLRWGTSSSNNRDMVRNGHHFQANQTHCKRGHEFDGCNTRWFWQFNSWHRACRACERARWSLRSHARAGIVITAELFQATANEKYAVVMAECVTRSAADEPAVIPV